MSAKKQINLDIPEKIEDGIYMDKEGMAKALAQVSKISIKLYRKAVALAKISCYVMENNNKRELTTEEASAFVKSGYSNPPR